MTDKLSQRLADLDPVLETDFDTQIGVERDPYGATQAIEKALYLLRDQADRIEQLTVERDRLREALNQSRLAFAGYVSVQSAIDLIDRAALKGESHD